MFSSGSFDEQVRKVEEFLESRLLKSSAGELTEEEIKEKKQEIKTMAPAVTRLASIQVRKLKGLNQIADKLQRRGLGTLSSLVLGIEDSKVTEKDIVDLSIQVDKSLNQGMKPSSIEDCINSFIEKINNREEEQRQKLEQIRQERLVAQQQAEKERQEKLVAQQRTQEAQQQAERYRQEKEELRRRYEEMIAALSFSSSSNSVSSSSSSSSSPSEASSSDGNHMSTSESSKPFLPLNATHERKRKISSSSDSDSGAEERSSPSLRGTSTTTPNTPSSDK